MSNAIKVMTLLLVVFALAACGGNAAQPTANTEAQPTTESAAENNTAATAPELSQSYTSDGEQFSAGLSFQYPSGWVVTTPITNIILVATSQATADKTFTGAALEPGEAVIQLGLNTRTDSDEDIAAHVSGFAGSIGIPLGEATATTMGDHAAARVDGSNDNRHLMAMSVLFEGAVDVAVGSGDTYVEAVAYTNPGEFAQMEPTLLAIIESINYSDQ